jgi:hypothetical protein
MRRVLAVLLAFLALVLVGCKEQPVEKPKTLTTTPTAPITSTSPVQEMDVEKEIRGLFPGQLVTFWPPFKEAYTQSWWRQAIPSFREYRRQHPTDNVAAVSVERGGWDIYLTNPRAGGIQVRYEYSYSAGGKIVRREFVPKDEPTAK